jgi:phage gp16-like protein
MIDRSLQVAIQTGRRQLGLDDGVYRAILQRHGNVDSSKDLTDQAAQAVLLELRSKGFEPTLKSGRKTYRGRSMAQQPAAKKARALWLALWNLDETETASEAGLNAFARGITGKEDLRFCSTAELNQVVEGLKAWASRSGVRLDGHPIDARRAIVREQWARLHRCGYAKAKGDVGLEGYAHFAHCTPNARTLEQMEAPHLDALAAKLGPLCRKHKVGRRHTVSASASA